MDIFGWDNHVERIEANWKKTVKEEDTVVLPGDFSWALKLEQTLADFAFLESLPGKKLLLKGNHDLWWSTVKKTETFLKEHGIASVGLVFNNAAAVGDCAVCGTRGWMFSEKQEDRKIILREAARLETSLKAALAAGLTPLVFLHYPPAYAEDRCEEILAVLKKYGVDTVYYGHIHGKGFHRALSEIDGIRLKLISCDCLDFTPYFIN